MFKKIKNYLLAAFVAVSLGAPALAPAAIASAAQAANNQITNNLCLGANSAAEGDKGTDDGCNTGSTDNNATLKKVGSNIVNIFSIIVGIVSVIMIIYGGFRYITSGGDSGRVGNAKNTLIYAIIGLIVVALAQFIVHYVLSSTESAVG